MIRIALALTAGLCLAMAAETAWTRANAAHLDAAQ